MDEDYGALTEVVGSRHLEKDGHPVEYRTFRIEVAASRCPGAWAPDTSPVVRMTTTGS